MNATGQKVLVLGGDGFCGWATSLHLSAMGMQVKIVDNFSRRKIDVELGTESLTPILPLDERIAAWNQLNSIPISWVDLDLSKDYLSLVNILKEFKPDTIIHFAEQRAAPYSMKSAKHKRFTMSNNINVTNNLCAAVVESQIEPHVVHLGTMGVYGYGTAGLEIPEGYLKVFIDSGHNELIENEILYPTAPGSIYHLTKSMDQLIFAFYAKNDQIRFTDLHQGIVWGTQTAETLRSPLLINRFDYDGDFGTVLNRFLVQAALNYPLTVHGTGGQTRAFIHIRDTIQCIALAVLTPPEKGSRVRIMNQMTETHRIRDLATMVSGIFGTPIAFLDNPRKESAENELKVRNDSLISLGLSPITLEQDLVEEIENTAIKFSSRVNISKIPCVSKW